jgi:hypothetical protein
MRTSSLGQGVGRGQQAEKSAETDSRREFDTQRKYGLL